MTEQILLCEECGCLIVRGVDGDYLAEREDGSGEFPMHDKCADRLNEIILLEGALNPLPIEHMARITRRIATLLGKDEEWVQEQLRRTYS